MTEAMTGRAQATQEATHEATQRMGGLLAGYRVTQMLHVAARLGLADALAGGPMAVDALARAAGCDAVALFRLLRALAPIGVFAERDDGRFETTALADTLRSDAPGSLRPQALTYGEPWWWGAYGELLHCVRTGGNGFEQACGMPLFDYLGRHPDAARVFNDNMSAMTAAEAEAVAAAADLGGLRLLADIGGGHGTLAAAILRRRPAARALLFDQPSVIAGAPAALARLGIAERCDLVAGDFFASVPAGADVYLLKDILHDWDDAQAVAILRQVREAMREGARLLVVERIIPPGNAPFAGKDVDITMMVMLGGRERTEAEYRQLLDAAGLTVARIVPTAVPSSVIEAVRSAD
ncbi:MAG: hypothetical protein JSR59_23340 [Proteobacteria bacterium]|nr:hypothetical protein [Pseudomonadota bacterium]